MKCLTAYINKAIVAHNWINMEIKILYLYCLTIFLHKIQMSTQIAT